MARPTGALEKSLGALTIAVADARVQRAAALREGFTGEHSQQVHVPLSGSLTATWGYADKDVQFEMPFLYAADQRAVPFEVPHFTHGIEFVTPPPELVIVLAHVQSWLRTPENWIVGANIRFAACAPLFTSTFSLREHEMISAPVTGSGVSFNAMAHLSFEGYATYSEGTEFQT